MTIPKKVNNKIDFSKIAEIKPVHHNQNPKYQQYLTKRTKLAVNKK